MRWIFQCFEGVSLVTLPPSGAAPPIQQITGLLPVHEVVVALLGSSCAKRYLRP